jgi:DNA modification methylase
MQIVEKKITELKAYKKNPRKNDNAVAPVAESIKEFGFKVPIIVDKDNVIVAGHTRLRAAKKLGMKSVPCIVADDLTPQQIKAFRVADNSSAQIASWDLSLLNDELMDLDFDMSIFGLEKEIKDIERIFAPEIIEDVVPEVDEKNIITKLGDIWQLGRHRLMCGDSTKNENIKKLTDGKLMDLGFFDPPYELDSDDWLICCNFVKKGYPIFIMASDKQQVRYVTKINNFRTFFVYDKEIKRALNNYQPMRQHVLISLFVDKQGDYFNCKKDNFSTIIKERPDHDYNKNGKSVTVVSQLLSHYNHRGSSVLDCFGGGGSTLIACEQLNRSCYMMELNPKYCDVIIKRYIAFKGTSDDVYRINADGIKTKYEDIT